MSQHRWSCPLNVVVLMICSFIAFSGCAKQPTKTAIVDQPSDAKQEALFEKQSVPEQTSIAIAEKTVEEFKAKTEAIPTEIPKSEPMISEQKKIAEAVPVLERTETSKRKLVLKDYHVVRQGDSLWWIAKYKDRYNDPFLWPLIYKKNINNIKNPNHILPGQKFSIPRSGYTMDTIQKARKKAGAGKPYLPPREANVPIN